MSRTRKGATERLVFGVISVNLKGTLQEPIILRKRVITVQKHSLRFLVKEIVHCDVQIQSSDRDASIIAKGNRVRGNNLQVTKAIHDLQFTACFKKNTNPTF